MFSLRNFLFTAALFASSFAQASICNDILGHTTGLLQQSYKPLPQNLQTMARLTSSEQRAAVLRRIRLLGQRYGRLDIVNDILEGKLRPNAGEVDFAEAEIITREGRDDIKAFLKLIGSEDLVDQPVRDLQAETARDFAVANLAGLSSLYLVQGPSFSSVVVHVGVFFFGNICAGMKWIRATEDRDEVAAFKAMAAVADGTRKLGPGESIHLGRTAGGNGVDFLLSDDERTGLKLDVIWSAYQRYAAP